MMTLHQIFFLCSKLQANSNNFSYGDGTATVKKTYLYHYHDAALSYALNKSETDDVRMSASPKGEIQSLSYISLSCNEETNFRCRGNFKSCRRT